MMTDDELDRLDALAQAATPGPWLQGMWSGRCERPDHSVPHPGAPECTYTQYLRTYPQALRYVSVAPNVTLIGGSDEGPWLDAPNAAFIAASREAVPALVAEVRRLRVELAILEAVADSIDIEREEAAATLPRLVKAAPMMLAALEAHEAVLEQTRACVDSIGRGSSASDEVRQEASNQLVLANNRAWKMQRRALAVARGEDAAQA